MHMPNVSLSRSRISALFSPSFFLMVLAAISLLLFSDAALAADAGPGGGSGLQWEGPIAKIRDSISGPVAFAIALLGIVVCGAMLIWGGEISEFVRRLIMLVMVISLIVFANSILTGALFSGAMLPDAVLVIQPATTSPVGG